MSKNKKSEDIYSVIADQIIDSGVDVNQMFEKDGLLKQLTKRLLEKALDTEMNSHLGYSKHQRSNSSNARNGYSNKSLSTDTGNIDISIPRDRDSNFEPQIVPKRVTKINGLDQKIISLYAKGMSTTDIQQQLFELYDTKISTSFISDVTEAIIDDVKAWQNRPLESVYPIVFFDCIVVKVREDKHIINKAVYVALGISLTGHKDVLGLWISQNEGAKYWLGVFTELKNRGLQDIFIACTDNLKGMSDAIQAIYPETKHQLCMVHQIRNSLKYVPYKDKKEVARELKKIYDADTIEIAQSELDNFANKYDAKYPLISKSWTNNWDNLTVFLQYPPKIRKVIYTTNAIESLNSQFRKVIKNKKLFPKDDSVFKSLYLAIDYLTKKWSMPVRYWNEAMPYFAIEFEDRIQRFM
ncbi:IS256 family transposase [Allofrancisella inopinata]|uniref:Mutator family transposase n=2 Tax=Allofrancisella inopinata TaxID=1085647 RepID=A0AAE7CR12_9GAMM|nr:IS256 family transposase [Allofrancisella inopinata]QIV95353.1 IS256 family transposase [Allofrancisella inopinata]QIV95573.1 IS256 family transposase [Allofrancisella inopinata]QIV95896.1 IS256 family transposase [Allofrancisella inopinata]QIV96347.1 IS256 family transposase [Allofrancisella inopinata]QIV96480.1 IS256 family transposase [Allofrancisella inopinata]